MAADLLTISEITKEAVKRFRASPKLVNQASLADYYLQQGVLQQAIDSIVGDEPDAPVWQRTAVEVLEQQRAAQLRMDLEKGQSAWRSLYEAPAYDQAVYDQGMQVAQDEMVWAAGAVVADPPAPALTMPSWPPKRELIFEEIAPPDYGYMLVRPHAVEVTDFVCQAR